MNKRLMYLLIIIALLQSFNPCVAAASIMQQFPLSSSGSISLSVFFAGTPERLLQVLICDCKETLLLKVYDSNILVAGLVRPKNGMYTFFKAHLKDAVHEEMIGLSVCSSKNELGDLFILGLDDNNEFVTQPLINECQHSLYIALTPVQDGNRILFPLAYHYNRFIVLFWDSSQQSYVARVEYFSNNLLAKIPNIKERF